MVMSEDSDFIWSSRVDRAWGGGDLGAVFGETPVSPTPWGWASRRRSHADYDTVLVRQLLAGPPVLVDVDPRGLRATQPSVTRPGVSYYLTPRYERTGRTYADYDRASNRFPVVYRREDGERLIISGHHRAAAALIQGKPLAARTVTGPWGPPRDAATSASASASVPARPQDVAPPGTVCVTPLLTAGEPPRWDPDTTDRVETSDWMAAVQALHAGRRCHLIGTDWERSAAGDTQGVLIQLDLNPVDAAAQCRFARTGSLHRGSVRVDATGLTTADAAVRNRIRELSVHLRCGMIRGPLTMGSHPNDARLDRWQSCRCEDEPEEWPGCDVSRVFDLCILCLRGFAGGVSRWSWHGCRNCLEVNRAVGRLLGGAPIALGRHSIMNGRAIPFAGDPAEIALARKAFEHLVTQWDGLSNWKSREFRRLADSQAWGTEYDVPLRTWQDNFWPSPETSHDAFLRYTGIDPTMFTDN